MTTDELKAWLLEQIDEARRNRDYASSEGNRKNSMRYQGQLEALLATLRQIDAAKAEDLADFYNVLLRLY